MAGLCLGAAAVVLLVPSAGRLETLELEADDWRMRDLPYAYRHRAATRPSRHVPVEIDDASIHQFAPVVKRRDRARRPRSSSIFCIGAGPPQSPSISDSGSRTRSHLYGDPVKEAEMPASPSPIHELDSGKAAITSNPRYKRAGSRSRADRGKPEAARRAGGVHPVAG